MNAVRVPGNVPLTINFLQRTCAFRMGLRCPLVQSTAEESFLRRGAVKARAVIVEILYIYPAL